MIVEILVLGERWAMKGIVKVLKIEERQGIENYVTEYLLQVDCVTVISL